MQEELIKRAKELLADGTVARVLGWKAGDLPYNPEPSYFENEDQLKNFVYKWILRCKPEQIHDRSFQAGRKNAGILKTM